MKRRDKVLTAILLVILLVLTPLSQAIARSQDASRTFPETGKTISGKFLDYWTAHGGLTQQGYPISEEMLERSDTNGKTYTVQYFERAVFEAHPENAAPYDVLLSLLGTFRYKQKYPAGAPAQTPNTSAGSRLFPETGKRVGGAFLDYWNDQGGLAQQGLPLSDEFNEVSELDSKTYKVQYFERAVFEYHSENVAPYDVLLSQLGRFRYAARYAAMEPGAAGCDTGGTRDGKAEPAGVRIGGRVRISAWGFTPNEPLSFWITDPNGSVGSTKKPDFQVPASGGFYTDITTNPKDWQLGRYVVTFAGDYSKHQSVIYFCLVP